MARDLESGSLLPGDDVYGDDTLGSDASLISAYLWGFLIVLILLLALRQWSRGRLGARLGGARDRLWDIIVMALLWPLFFATVIFIVLWTALTRRGGR